MILFGVRSPLILEVEESLHRLGVAVEAAVSVNDTPRVFDRSKLVDLADFVPQPGQRFIATAFSPQRRAELIAQARALGLELAEALIDPTAILPRMVRIGDGSYINAGVVIGSATLLGEAVLVNRAASLGHHVVLGDRVTIGPGATLAGDIRVGADSVIGAGAVIQPDVRIGANVLVSAGSVVRKHVPDNVLMAGNPAVVQPFRSRGSSLRLSGGE
jgi:sugar O-acyltransferase (sialic acid O-acetyltransferase NeuD family)